MSRKLLSFILILVLALGMVGISNAQDEEPIKVGAIFDLSGPTGDVGSPYAEGVIAYVDWRNENGGINGRPIELISQDYAYSVETAENLYTQFVEEGAVVFLGWGTGDSEALRTRIAEDEVPFISASYSANLNDPMGDAPYNFLIATTYGDQMTIMMTHMLQEWEAAGNAAEDMKVAVFHHDSPFGTSPLPDAEAFAESNGVEVLAVPMPRGATDYTAELQQADDFGVTHIIVQNVSSPAALLAANALDFFGDPEFYDFGCLNWCADELFVTLAGDAAEGALGVIPFTPTTVEVDGQEAPRDYLGGQEELEAASLHFTQGWTAMSVMAEAIARTLDNEMELTGPNIRATLESMEGYETGGILAPVTFTPEDHRSTRASRVYSVDDGVWVEASDLIDLRAMDGDM
ncbi:MAG: ABC transporter substrate-binding protein [Anaerolineae bacterium]|nr:ABC transporter substrate-binding protein [Anaerolineae bacterium]MDQ7034438.1 ABC transporter substrate-binding protein [Anaerolineae bacterium]